MPAISWQLRWALFLLLSTSLTTPASAVDVRFLAFGDSITAGWGFDEACACDMRACRQDCGYPARLEALFAGDGVDARVLNEGLGGEKTPEGLTRLDEVFTEIPPIDTMLLMEGTNDISQNVSPECTLFNLSEMGRKASLQGADTLHATLVPRFPQARVDAENLQNAGLAGGLRDLAFTSGRDLADPFEVFLSTENLFEELYHDSDTDPVGHPNAQGFDLLTRVFFDTLTGIDEVPPVLGHVEPADGSVDVAPLQRIRVRMYDFGSGLTLGSSALLLNDEIVSFESVGGENWQDLTFQPTTPLPGEVAVRVQATDRFFNTFDREISRFSVDTEVPGVCVSDTNTLCIDRDPGDRRFQIRLHWQTSLNGGQEGDALATPLAQIGLRRGGLFSFFNLDNPEVLVKVLDGCTINNRFWVFVSPTTTLGYELEVIDTRAALEGARPSVYRLVETNRDGREAPPLTDTGAFVTCDFGSP